MQMSRKWLAYAIITTITWGLWGALTGLYADEGIPSTLVYSIWAVTMLLPCFIVLQFNKWSFNTDKKSMLLGCTIGLLGSGGQMLLFKAVNIGPSYLIFPLISLSPLITICLSFLLLKERTGPLGATGIALALIALPLFEYSTHSDVQTSGVLWFVFAFAVMIAWGLQAYFIKSSNLHMSAESIFVYMTFSAIALVPLALWMTDFQQDISINILTIVKTAGIQVLNAIGALFLVLAFRYGKAIVVSPLTNAGAPLITTVLVIMLMGSLPAHSKIIAIGLAIIAAVILAMEPEGQLNDQPKGVEHEV